MRSLFLGSAVERSGKTMVTLGLAKNFPGKVGFFKPFKETLMALDDRVIDQDAYLMKKALGLPQTEEILSPFTYDMDRPVEMDQIIKSYEMLKAKVDLMLIEGTREITTASFSRPWKPSTLSISRPGTSNCPRSRRTCAA